MGLAASSYNLMKYMNRKNDIGRQLSQLSLQKMSLTRDVNKITKEYQRSMNTKVYKYTNNAGADYFDLSYSSLMYPGTLNGSKLNMLTDMNGKVVVDSKYRRYAEMISPEGTPGGDYESNRAAILSDLLGIAPEDIDRANEAYLNILEQQDILDSTYMTEPQKQNYSFYNDNPTAVLGKLGSSYSPEDEIDNVSDLTSFINLMKGLSCYFPDEQQAYINQCDAQLEVWTTELGNENHQTLKQRTVADNILGGFNYWYDINDSSYTTYQNEHSAWEADRNNAQENLDFWVSEYNSVFDSGKRAKADFYDELFSSIAENGWQFYEQISNPEYLNNMLLNGLFNITTVDRECIREDDGYVYENHYVTDPANTCVNLVQVNDTDYNNQKYIEYEHKKTLLNEKEERIDTRMKNLETEQSALKQMIESVKNVMNNNIEQHYNIFTA